MAVRFTALSPITLTVSSAIPVGSSTVQCSSIFIQADPLNTNNIYWGDSTVTASNGSSLAAGEKVTIRYDGVMGNSTNIPLGSVYLTTDTTGNLARVSYFQVS